MKSYKTILAHLDLCTDVSLATEHSDCPYTLRKVNGGYKITNPYSHSDIYPTVIEALIGRMGICNFINRKLLDNPYMFGYVTIETQGNRMIQALSRNGITWYRLVENGVVTKRQKFTGNISNRIKFSCKSYCSDCGCSKW
jgi:hypothetical protein